MLTFEEKQAIIESFPQLTKKEVSMKRINYHFEDSVYEKTVVVQYLHPNGNGFVFIGDLPQYNADQRGLVNIREATEDELRSMIEDSIQYLSESDPDDEVEDNNLEQEWRNSEGQILILAHEDERWNIYTGLNLEESFGSKEDAQTYLKDEGFQTNF
ncbi:hypothetical protein [Pseudogracilibacillus auburnensis]|uniref:hypothetical protein n=1 Tax=Pseudogracilibacillus auburnensis TaxID=1494959 RepID=UPI001A9777B2|nr:hypothetical protein [Pseudogracilibacillus auburnensis]MBO1004016.1 hypothetical protein [Pseudogracilibacillus auburnensis]